MQRIDLERRFRHRPGSHLCVRHQRHNSLSNPTQSAVPVTTFVPDHGNGEPFHREWTFEPLDVPSLVNQPLGNERRNPTGPQVLESA